MIKLDVGYFQGCKRHLEEIDMVRDLDLLYSINTLFNKRIIVYGAGNNASYVIYVLRQIGVDNIELCDSDSKKDGAIVGNIKCSLWGNIKDRVTPKDVVIISTGIQQYQDEIISIIHQHNPYISIYTIFALEQSCIFNVKQLPESEYKKHKFFDIQVKHILLTSMQTAEDYKHQLNNLKYFTFLTDEELPIIILQPAKVGSSSVLEGLRAKDKSALHLHNIEPMEYNKGDILRYSKKRKIKLITLIREPIARQISLLFQWIGTDIYNNAGVAELEVGFNMRGLMSKFFQMETFDNLLDEFEWFDREIKQVFDIDVYKYPFDKEKGYTIIEKDNIEMLLIKTEKLNSLENVIGIYTECDSFRLVNCNIGKLKEYRFAYEQFVNEYEIPDDFVRYYYHENSRMDHFYTEEEKAEFLKKWRKKADQF